jgi:hypothetical protein
MTETNYPSASPNFQSPAPKGKNTKNIIIGFMAAFFGFWGYLLYDKNKAEKKSQVTQITKLTDEKMVAGKLRCFTEQADPLTGANNSLQGEKAFVKRY